MSKNLKKTFIHSFVSSANRLRLIDMYSFIKSNVESYVAVIVYHRIKPIKDRWSISTLDSKEFEKQILYIKKTHKILDLEEMANIIKKKKKLPKRSAVITFDDGYLDNYKYAFPVLEKHKIPATIFLTTGFIGGNDCFWWDKLGYVIFNTKMEKINLRNFGEIYPKSIRKSEHSFDIFIERFKQIPKQKRLRIIEELVTISDIEIPKQLGKELILSWDQVKEMDDHGIKFGAHTVNHPILTEIPLKQAEKEIIESKKDIEKKIKKPINTFCYPNGQPGDYNDDIKNILRENGFICSLTLLFKTVTKKSDLFELGRIFTVDNFSFFKLNISGFLTDMTKWKYKKN